MTLMRHFYETWLGGASKREALRQAQAVVRREHEFTPYYWGAFVLIGE